MGQRGPKPFPANVHLLKGNPSKKPVAQLLGEFKPEVEIPDCPKVLLTEAKKHWAFLTQELHRYGLISLIDRGLLAMGCQEWATWFWAQQQIRKANKDDPLGEKGFIETSQSGYRMQSVYLQISKNAQANYEKIVAHFGMSPSARSRVTPSDNYPFLPGMELPEDAKAGDQKPAAHKASLAELAR